MNIGGLLADNFLLIAISQALHDEQGPCDAVLTKHEERKHGQGRVAPLDHRPKEWDKVLEQPVHGCNTCVFPDKENFCSGKLALRIIKNHLESLKQPTHPAKAMETIGASEETQQQQGNFDFA